jgi:hypothetical protein
MAFKKLAFGAWCFIWQWAFMARQPFLRRIIGRYGQEIDTMPGERFGQRNNRHLHEIFPSL